MKENSKILIIVVVILLVVVMGVSFAYFAVGVTIGGEGGKTNIQAGGLPLVEYDAGDRKLEKDGLVPKDILSKTFKVKVTPTKDIKEVTYRIYMKISENTFEKCNDSNYNEVTNRCEKEAEELVYRLKDSSGNIIKTGDLTSGITGEIELVRETKRQEARTEYEYIIEIEYKETNAEQNHNANKIFNGEIKVEYAEKVKTIEEIIATLNAKTEQSDFSKIAESDEGVFEIADGMHNGTSYYWRGASTTNHLIFANKCWRIVRINGDKTVRLIYNGTVKTGNTCTGNGENNEAVIMGSGESDRYYATSDGQYNKSYYVGWTYVEGKQRPETGDTAIDSNVKVQTENWYNSNIGNNTNYASKVADGKFCNDRNTGVKYSGWDGTWSTTWSENETQFAYAAVDRVWNKYQPTLSCDTGDVYTLKVGAITVDEVMMAGGKTENNTSYYMHTGQNYWTMTPRNWGGNTRMFIVNTSGYLDGGYVSSAYVGLRPVINLRSDVLLAGNGTIDNPYEVIY